MRDIRSIVSSLFGGAVAVSLGFVAMRFLLAPVRIRILTEIMAPADYGMVTLISMSATALAFVFSLGGFEVWLRWLPAATTRQARAGIFKPVFLISSSLGITVALLIAGGVAPSVWYGDGTVSLSPAAVALYVLLFLHMHQRIYFLLGCHDHRRARITQLLWGDVWFLLLLPFGFSASWTANEVLWLWSGWIVFSTLCTWRWVPVIACFAGRNEVRTDYRMALSGTSILAIVLAEWIFRLGGQYVLLAATDAATMAIYALVINIALVGMAAGVPLVDVFIAQFNTLNRPDERTLSPDIREQQAVLFSRFVRMLLVLSVVVALALVFLAKPMVHLLAAREFRGAADHLPWAALLPFFMLFNLLLGRLALSQSRAIWAAVSSVAGAIAGLVGSVNWVGSRGTEGIVLGITAGLAMTFMMLAFRMGIGRWLTVRVLRPVRLVAGLIILGGLFCAIARLEFHAAIQALLAGLSVMLCGFAFKWIEVADLLHAREGGEEPSCL